MLIVVLVLCYLTYKPYYSAKVQKNTKAPNFLIQMNIHDRETSRHEVYGVIIAKYVSTKAVHLMDCRHHIP